MELTHMDFLAFPRPAVGTGKMLDMEKAYQIVKENEGKLVMAGLAEDWTYTSADISSGEALSDEGAPCFSSRWATPVVVVDYDVIIECWVEDDGTFDCFSDGEIWEKFYKSKEESQCQ